jgi:hypothetical protein
METETLQLDAPARAKGKLNGKKKNVFERLNAHVV